MAIQSQYFRANVGAVIADEQGLILALERADVPGAWQLPQGGLDAGEEPQKAVLREVREETGLVARALEGAGRYPEPLVYELPPRLRSPKTGRGQVQYWFYFRLRGPATPVLPSRGEFRAFRWMPFSDLIEKVVSFRRPVYAKLADYFEREILGKTG